MACYCFFHEKNLGLGMKSTTIVLIVCVLKGNLFGVTAEIPYYKLRSFSK